MPATVDLPLAARQFCAEIRNPPVAGKARSYKSPLNNSPARLPPTSPASRPRRSAIGTPQRLDPAASSTIRSSCNRTWCSNSLSWRT
jgi:hypothetical protein